MKHDSPIQKAFIGTASTLIGVYLALAFIALLCTSAHSGHHQGTNSHSNLCTWACQANHSGTLISLVAPIQPILLVVFFGGLLFLAILTSPENFARSRAPPPSFPFPH